MYYKIMSFIKQIVKQKVNGKTMKYSIYGLLGFFFRIFLFNVMYLYQTTLKRPQL